MNLFDRLVSEALRNQNEMVPQQSVVEKELLHHDILREMSSTGLLSKLTFIGGTCLRDCYGSSRLSGNLEFTGDRDFNREILSGLDTMLIKRLKAKYDLQVEVSEPVKETGNVDTWKIKVVTHPGRKNLPAQKILIDICSIPSYDRQPLMLRNHYGVEMGTSTLIIQAESLEEILADKIVAFALRPNRLKNRDLWDIGWLKQRGIVIPAELVKLKLSDHRRTIREFLGLLEDRNHQLDGDPSTRKNFIHEMKRFLPPKNAQETVENKDFWKYLTNLIQRESLQLTHYLTGAE